MAQSVSLAANRPEIWQKELYANVIDNLYFTKNNMMGKGANNIVQIKDELTKQKGDTVTFPLTTKLSGSGVTGDSELEGNEERITAYSQSIVIDQWRNAVRLTGKLDEQTNSYDMRSDAKDKLSIQAQEFIERQIFLKLGGVTLTTLVDVAGVVYSARAAFANSPAAISDANTAAGIGNRYLCANSSGADALAATDKITPALISRLRIIAEGASPKIQPIKINGKNWYLLFVHPYQAYDLKQNAVFSQAQREALPRSEDNPIFTNAMGAWDGVIIHSHEYCPFLDKTVAYNFNTAAGGTNYGVDAYRAILCGQQAAGFAQCKNPNGWVEKSFDYDNEVGFATALIGGIQKILFNSKEYGTIVLDTASSITVA